MADENNYAEQLKTFSNSKEFKNSIPAQIDADTVKNFIENENAAKELLSQITQEKSRDLDNNNINKTINNPERKITEPSFSLNV